MTHPHPVPMDAEVAARIAARRAELRAHLGALLAGWDSAVLELGSGHGHYLTAFAAAHPEKRCIGVDLIGDRVDRALRKAERSGVRNLNFLKAEALETLEAWPEQVDIRLALALFPDPWPKKRHHKNRMIRADLLSALARRAAPGARLCFRTDHEEFFTASVATVAAQPEWALEPEAAAAGLWPFELETVFQSKADRYWSLVATRVAR